MNNLLYLIALVMIIIWCVGFFAYDAGAKIHILLVVAVISILVRIARVDSTIL